MIQLNLQKASNNNYAQDFQYPAIRFSGKLVTVQLKMQVFIPFVFSVPKSKIAASPVH